MSRTSGCGNFTFPRSSRIRLRKRLVRRKAEDFARFFGTPTFLIAQTLIVALWIWVNAAGWTQFDVYPFILLNLAFST